MQSRWAGLEGKHVPRAVTDESGASVAGWAGLEVGAREGGARRQYTLSVKAIRSSEEY